MRILHVTHQYPPAIGGSELYIGQLSEAMATRGHAVDVVTTRSGSVDTWGGSLPRRETLNGVKVYRHWSMPRTRIDSHLLRIGNQKRWQSGKARYEPLILWGRGPTAPGIVKHILQQGHKYDVIHFQALPFFHIVYGSFVAKRMNIPVVMTPHIHIDQPEAFDLTVFRKVLAMADAVFVVSDMERPYLKARGVSDGQIFRSGNGIEPDLFPHLDQQTCRKELDLPSDAQIILFLGRKVEYKGLAIIVKAINRLQVRYPNVMLISAGPHTPESRSLYAEFGDTIRWLDRDVVTHEEKVQLLNACDLLALPSTGEAFGIVYLEAWMAEKPVIGANVGAVPYVIQDGVDGLLVRPNDVADLASKLKTLLDCPDSARALGQAGRKKVLDQYTIDKIADQVEMVYRQVVES